MFWIAYLAIAAFYAVTVSGHIKSTIPLLLLLLAALGILVGMHEKEFMQEAWPQLRKTCLLYTSCWQVRSLFRPSV